MMKVLAFLALVVLVATQVHGAPTCYQKFNTCRLSNVAQPPSQCVDQLTTCATNSCTCMDLNMAAVTTCPGGVSSDVQACASDFNQRFQQCVQTCSTTGFTNVSVMHLADAHVVTLFGLPSKCDICKDIVHIAEGKGKDFACDALDVTDLIPGCDVLGPVCGIVFDAVCDKILDMIISHTPLDAGNVCGDAGFCKSSLLASPSDANKIQMSAASANHRVATVTTLSKKGMSQYLQRHSRVASQYSSLTCYANPHSKSTKTQYTCMEQLSPVQSTSLVSSSTNTGSSSSANPSQLGMGVGIGVASAFAVMAVVAGVMYVRRRRYQGSVESTLL